MKKLIIMVSAAVLSATLPLVADTETVNGIRWNYTVSNGKAEVGIYEYERFDGGFSASYLEAIPTSTTGALIIPSTLGGYPVTSIGYWAFSRCSGLTSVTIPDGVTSIGYEAFEGCRALTSVTIPASVTSIGDRAFAWCEGLTSVTIPDSVTSIGDSAFVGCRGLADADGFRIIRNVLEAYYGTGGNVVIPDGVTSIGDWAFEDCRSLTSVTIPNSVTNIGDSAFEDCRALTSVTIPNSVTHIGHWAFEGCKALTSIMIPSSVKYIGSAVFADCSSLKSVIMPKWCKTINVYWRPDIRGYLYDETGGYELSDKRISRTDWWPVGFVFYAFVDVYDDDADEDAYHHYKDYEKQITKGVKITYKDVKSGSGGDVAEIWKKAQTVNGAVFRGGKAVGVIQVKVGKASKNGEVAVSGTITGIDGKKLTAKGGKVGVNGETATATLTVKDGTTATVTVGKDGVSGSWNGAEIKAADVGGSWSKDGAKVYVDATGTSLPAWTQEALWPDGETVLAKSGKWAFNKAATVKLSKDKTTAEWDTSKGKSNLSGLKLTYTPNTGLFKGSFKVYALEEASNGKKLKKYTANVTGVVVNGQGYGQATIKKPAAGPWAVTVE